MKRIVPKKPTHAAPLGQHFLTRPEIAAWVADAVPLSLQDIVLEIGPGHGILTHELLKRVGTVYAIEKDTLLVRELQHTFAQEIANGRLVLLEEDVRDFDPNTLGHTPYTLIANIPYYITGYIVRKFLSAAHQPQAMALLMQKEVATRIVAVNKKESLLSLSVKVFGTPSIAHIVRAGAFSPPPKVDSAILRITNISKTLVPSQEIAENLFSVLHKAFVGKRKQLGNSLGAAWHDRLTHCGIPLQARPEDVPVEQWLCLLNAKDITS